MNTTERAKRLIIERWHTNVFIFQVLALNINNHRSKIVEHNKCSDMANCSWTYSSTVHDIYIKCFALNILMTFPIADFEKFRLRHNSASIILIFSFVAAMDFNLDLPWYSYYQAN